MEGSDKQMEWASKIISNMIDQLEQVEIDLDMDFVDALFTHDKASFYINNRHRSAIDLYQDEIKYVPKKPRKINDKKVRDELTFLIQ